MINKPPRLWPTRFRRAPDFSQTSEALEITESQDAVDVLAHDAPAAEQADDFAISAIDLDALQKLSVSPAAPPNAPANYAATAMATTLQTMPQGLSDIGNSPGSYAGAATIPAELRPMPMPAPGDLGIDLGGSTFGMAAAASVGATGLVSMAVSSRDTGANTASAPPAATFVGVSGVGKTQILRAIDDLQDIANGRSINGFEWHIVFSTVSNKEYTWEGAFSILEDNDKIFKNDEDDNDGKIKPIIIQSH